MFVLNFVYSRSKSIGIKFWMIEAVFALIGQSEFCSFTFPSFFLKPPTGRLRCRGLTCLPHPGIGESLSTAIQDLVEERAWRSSVISQDFERFSASDGFCRGYQISQLSRRVFLAGRDNARMNTVRTVLVDFYYSL
jgi:hypothetical protein